jgi:hypothetical protein
MEAIVGRLFRLAWDLISIRFGARQRFTSASSTVM